MEQPRTLVVDLDGTLIRSDMLLETFWQALSSGWRRPLAAITALPAGRARVKRSLAEGSDVNVEILPYNQDVIAYVRKWKEHGGDAVLVTAADQTIADRIAAFLGIFDNVFGSDGTINLKGREKARFLVGRYGQGGFVYLADSAADLPVWKQSAKAITCNAGGRLRNLVERTAPKVEHISPPRRLARSVLDAMRPHQWSKNLLIFVPLILGHAFTGEALVSGAFGFLSFCLIASAVYVLNDLKDLDSDRRHPRKRNRPLASGALPLSYGMALVVGLLTLGVVAAFSLAQSFGLVVLGYIGLSSAYTWFLKRLAILDITVLSLLYSVRILAGSVATGVEVSIWLIAFSIFFFHSLAAVKRLVELVDLDNRGGQRAIGRRYVPADRQLMMQMAVSAGYVSVLILSIYIDSDAASEVYAQPMALWGICVVLLYWISRIVMIAERGVMHDDPVVFALNDRSSRLCLLVVLALLLIASVWW
jgi:4-hydroxybenzoate polyprenyltransferase/phosphoserine phosphatase